MNEVLLDSNCDQQNCKLKLGASHAFILNSINRNSNLNNNGKTFFESIFTSPNGKKLLRKCRLGTLEQYQDVIKGKKKTLLTIPPQFTYDKRIKPTTSIDEVAIEGKIKQKNGKTEKELRDIKAFFTFDMPTGQKYSPMSASVDTLCWHMLKWCSSMLHQWKENFTIKVSSTVVKEGEIEKGSSR